MAGSYGFGVRFPDGFVADDQDHRPSGPPAGCLKVDTAGWDVPLGPAETKGLLGACAATPISLPKFCM